ncbi:thioredoxin family protein [Geobacillus sp.]|uniref:thioredoxin family protein n=1 Tax=Geobacillus sp. TaxID=1891658 RepID=UPI00257AFEA4|nr:thioredoxin family protein [Geobacillus sp.]MBR2517872.1 thioredoxin family protein [Geobacillus sp.]
MRQIETVEQFEAAISGDKPAIMKFYTTWCPDCVRLNMFIDDIIRDYGQYDWFEIDRDQFLDISDKYQVLGIPSLLVFRNGEKIAHLHSADAKTPEEVRAFLQSLPE